MGIGRGLAAVAIAAAITASAAGAANGWNIRFSFVPQRAYQSQPAAVSAIVKPNARCSLLVRYVDGSVQTGLGMARAVSGRVSWKWSLAAATPVGQAKATVTCGPYGQGSRTFLVVGGTVRHSKLSLVRTGFSQRPNSYGSGSSVSYGVVLRNPSATEDAQNVTVQVNFIDSSNHTLETATNSIGTIAAGSTFNVGGYQSLPTQAPVVKLEVVVQTGSYVKHAMHEPAVENIHIVPATFEPNWVGEVDGDIVNDSPMDTLTNASAYVVLYDAAGNVVGGGTGFLVASLPPGTRSYFSASLGFGAVPMDKASTAEISIVPTYKAPGT
jgi:hypothetical protein